MMEFVSWDDDIPNIYIYMMGKIIHSCSKPPTNSWFNIHRKVLHLSSRIPGWFPCRLQHGRRFQAPSPVFRHAAARPGRARPLGGGGWRTAGEAGG
jgi:hypothetical protein